MASMPFARHSRRLVTVKAILRATTSIMLDSPSQTNGVFPALSPTVAETARLGLVERAPFGELRSLTQEERNEEVIKHRVGAGLRCPTTNYTFRATGAF